MEKADDLLIDPQMRFMKKKFANTTEEICIPLDVIYPVSYGDVYRCC